MRHRLDPRRGNVHIDTNALDPDDGNRTNVDRFLELIDQGAISVVAPWGVRQEGLDPRTPSQVSHDIGSQIFTIQTDHTQEDLQRRAKIRAVLQGDANPGKHDADAEHVFEAQKYGGRYFITHDKRINKTKRQELETLLDPFAIVTLDEFMAIYDKCIAAD